MGVLGCELGDFRTRPCPGLGILEGHPRHGRWPGVRLPVPPTWSGRRDPRPFRQRLRTLPFLRRNRRRGARGRPHPAVRGPCNRRRRIPRLVCDRRLASPIDAVGQVQTPTRAAVQPPPTPFAAPSPSPYPVPPTPTPGPPAGPRAPMP